MASPPARLSGFGVASACLTRRRYCIPAQIRQISSRVEVLRGVRHWFLSYGVSSRLPDPHRLAVPVRPVVVRAACRLPAHLCGSAALSFTSLLRQAGGRGPSPPPGHRVGEGGG